MCNNKQKVTTREKVWDDKFGMIERKVPVGDCRWNRDNMCGYNSPDSITKCIYPEQNSDCIIYEKRAVVDGVGKDAEIITNANGGKQSKSPMAMHLLDPQWLHAWAGNLVQIADDSISANYFHAIEHITFYMAEGTHGALDSAMYYLEQDELKQAVRIAKVLQYGAERYAVNNWRLIPREEHINHALIHIVAELMGDTQDEHIDHALTRLMMAQATQESEGFSYTQCTSNMTTQKV